MVYAFRLGAEGEKFRAADDGEPSGSSGMPVYNTIRSKNITDVIVLVVRYFGGTKLGIPGLIDAYSQAATIALDNAETIEKTIKQNITVEVPYSMVNFVMRIIKENNLTVADMSGETSCRITIAVALNQAPRIEELLNQNGKITV